MEAYLDNAATTPVFPEVRDIMVKVMEEDFGNPSSKHAKGIAAEKYITDAKNIIADIIKCQPKEIIFTSGGTEANNMALIGTALANARRGKHIITTCIEHASVHEPLAYLEGLGYEVTYLPVDCFGHVDEIVLENAVRDDTILVSVMYVNNEIGAVEDIGRLCDVAKRKNKDIIFHVDAIQAYGKLKIVPKKFGSYGIDLMSVSGHKIHAPKGSGFLYVKDKTKINPIIYGGGQQKGMRSGTENVPAIAGLGLASAMMYDNKSGFKADMLYNLKERLIAGLKPVEGAVINGIDTSDIRKSAPHIVNVGFEAVKSEVMLHALADKGVYVSSGSACSSNRPELSGTLKAIGVDNKLLDSSLRFSFSVMTLPEQIDYALMQVKEVLPVLRRFVKR